MSSPSGITHRATRPLRLLSGAWDHAAVPFYKPAGVPLFSRAQLAAVVARQAATVSTQDEHQQHQNQRKGVPMSVLEGSFGAAAYSTADVEDAVQHRLADAMPEGTPLPMVALPVCRHPAPVVVPASEGSSSSSRRGGGGGVAASCTYIRTAVDAKDSATTTSSTALVAEPPTWFRPNNGFFMKGVSVGTASAATRSFLTTAMRFGAVVSKYHVLCRTPSGLDVRGPASPTSPTNQGSRSGSGSAKASGVDNAVPLEAPPDAAIAWSPHLGGQLYAGLHLRPSGRVTAHLLPLSLVVGPGTTAHAMRELLQGETQMASLFAPRSSSSDGGKKRPAAASLRLPWVLRRPHPFLSPEQMLTLQPLRNRLLQRGGARYFTATGTAAAAASQSLGGARRLQRFSRLGSFDFKLLHFNPATRLALLEVTTRDVEEHQIRAALAHGGLPVVGDFVYDETTADAVARVHEALERAKSREGDASDHQSTVSFASLTAAAAGRLSPLSTVVGPLAAFIDAFAALTRECQRVASSVNTISGEGGEEHQPRLEDVVDALVAWAGPTGQAEARGGKGRHERAVLSPRALRVLRLLTAPPPLLEASNSSSSASAPTTMPAGGMAWSAPTAALLRQAMRAVAAAAEAGTVDVVAPLALRSCIALSGVAYPDPTVPANVRKLQLIEFEATTRAHTHVSEERPSAAPAVPHLLARLAGLQTAAVDASIPQTFMLALGQKAPAAAPTAPPAAALFADDAQHHNNGADTSAATAAEKTAPAAASSSSSGDAAVAFRRAVHVLAAMAVGGLGEEDRGALLCAVCRQVGHTARQCPQRYDASRLPRYRRHEPIVALGTSETERGLDTPSSTQADSAAELSPYFADRADHAAGPVTALEAAVDAASPAALSIAAASESRPLGLARFVENQERQARRDARHQRSPALHRQSRRVVRCHFCAGPHHITECPKIGMADAASTSNGAGWQPIGRVGSERFRTAVFTDAVSSPQLLFCIRCGAAGHLHAQCPTLPAGFADGEHCTVCLQRCSVGAHEAHQCRRRKVPPTDLLEPFHACGVPLSYTRSAGESSPEPAPSRRGDREERAAHRNPQHREAHPPHRSNSSGHHHRGGADARRGSAGDSDSPRQGVSRNRTGGGGAAQGSPTPRRSSSSLFHEVSDD